MREIPVPVLMYHTVGIPDPAWQWRYLTCPYGLFDQQMRWLKRAGFVSVTLNDLQDHVFAGKGLPRKSFVLTFDDGYADNWIFAYPILKRFGFRGTIFVSPEFVDGRDIVRKRLDEVESPGSLGPEETRGFLSWPEMREAEKDGTLDIQAHAMTHTWYPISEKIVDFRHPGDPYIWMTWNEHVERKPYLQIDDETLVGLGDPVYEHGKSLSSPRYLPNRELALRVREYVGEHGGRKFFERPDWREVLFERARSAGRDLDPGRCESDEEYYRRLRAELSESKRIIEEQLEKRVEFLCWPGGSGSSRGVELAREIGYGMTTAARDMPAEVRNALKNIPPQGSDRIARTSPMLYWDGRAAVDSKIVYDSGFTLVLNLLGYKRIGLTHLWGRMIRKFLKEIHRIS